MSEADSSTHPESRKRRREDGEEQRSSEVSQGANFDDGSAAGGSTFALLPTIAQTDIWADFSVTNRVLKTYRLFSSYINFQGDARVLVFYPDTLGPEIPLSPRNVVMYTQHSYRLSNLIIMNDVIDDLGGTVQSATSFNESPYVIVMKDKVKNLGKVLALEQFPDPAEVVPGASSLQEVREYNTFVEINAIKQRHMDAQFWKQGDNAIEWSYPILAEPIVVPDTTDEARQSAPMASWQQRNVQSGVDAINQISRLVDNCYPVYIGVPKISGAQGDVKFSFSVMIEETVAGKILIHDDAVPWERVMIGTKFISGDRNMYCGDVRAKKTWATVNAAVGSN